MAIITTKGALDSQPQVTATSDKVYQLLAHSQWLSPGTPAPSTTKTGCHDIAEILLKVALNTKNQNKKSMAIIVCRKPVMNDLKIS